MTKNTNNMTKTRDEILKTFDFTKVHKAMVVFDWKWFDRREAYIPTESDLRGKAKSLLDTVISGEHYQLQSGGFTASLSDEEGGRVLRLDFVLETSGDYV